MKISTEGIKYNLYLILIILICIVIPYNSEVQAEMVQGLKLPLKSNGDLLFYSDIYQFETIDDKIRMEVCYSLDLAQLYIESQPRDEYSFTFNLKLVDKTGKSVLNVSDKKRIGKIESQSEGFGAFIDLVKFDIKPDSLKFVLLLSDSLSGKKGIINIPILVRPVSKKLSCSDPVFIAYLKKSSGDNTVFTRHQLEMIPNPARFYETQTENNFLYVYFEINNLAYFEDRPSLYSLMYSVESLAGDTMSHIAHLDIKKVGANTSRIEKVSLADLTTGMYSLNMQIFDSANDNNSSIRRYFRVVSQESGTPMVIPMEDADVEKYYDQIKYIARDQELRLFEQLDAVGKQEFLLYFWKFKDPTPGTPENEFMIDHFRKIEYCKQNFRNGLNSDRGRVYIQYGPPVDVERSTSTMAYSKPVEIWTYSLEGRIEFVFVDRTGDDNFVLMHSTHPDEYYNPEWAAAFKVYR